MIYDALDKGKDACLVSLDASSAFDRVWHDGLIYKLSQKGIRGDLFNLFKSYLSSRVQRTVIKGQNSPWRDVTTGVPQGSILGPLLFLVYVDDIVKDIQSNILLFADDTSLVEVITDPLLSFDRLNQDLSRLNIWSKSWLVNFNPIKTAYIVFSKKLIRPNYPALYLDNIALKETSTHKQLGVIFNNRITFEDHIDAQCKKAMTRLTALKRVQRKIPRSSQLTIYLSFIRPILEYGWQLYDNTTKKSLSKLEKVQREALLSITRAYTVTSHNALLKETGVELLSSRRECGKKKFMYKYSADLLPNYLNDLIPDKVNTKSDYSLRTNENIKILVSKKNYYLKSFIPSSIKSWNEMDLQLRKSPSYDTFKRNLKKISGNSSYNMYLYGDSNGSINHSRIRMGLSGLSFHRKRVRFITDGACGHCNARSENSSHFFLECPAYAVQRATFLQNLRAIDGFNCPCDEDLAVKRHRDDFVETIVHGTKNPGIDKLIFTVVHSYISETQRFY